MVGKWKYYKGKTIDYYKTTNIILSDLGQEGILYGYEYFPIKNILLFYKQKYFNFIKTKI